MAEESARIFRLREKLRTGIMSQLDMVTVNGSLEHRLPGNLNISFAYVEGEALMMAIKDVAVSSGSACTSASLEPSYVLRACGVEEDMAHSSIRFGIGRFNTEEEVDYRGPPGRGQGPQAARHEPPLRDGQGRHRPQEHRVDGTLGAGQPHGRLKDSARNPMAYSDKVIEHYENPRNVGTLDKNDPERRHRPGGRARRAAT